MLDIRLLTLMRVVVVAFVAIAPARAADRPVDLELILAADISRSMDLTEASLQREGYAHAIRHPAVVDAIRAGAYGRIALMYMEWAGADVQRTLVPWTEVSDQAGADAVAQTILNAGLGVARRTSISTALLSAAARFDGNGYAGRRRIIDVSGDGPNNSGPRVNDARDRVIAMGITINGLPIISARPNPSGYPDLKELDRYYKDCVIGGPGRFMVVAHGFQDFARAIRRKLLLEIADFPPPVRLFHAASARRSIPCDIGERQLRDWLRNFDEY